MLEIIFWICIALVIYTYVGYGVLLYFLVRIKRLFVGQSTPATVDEEKLPEVTFLVCAYNEQDTVEMKIKNSRELDYPKNKLHLVWVTDGSNDKTNELLAQYDDVEVMFEPQRRGKTAALNRGLALVKTSIVIMTDANTFVNSGAVREVARLMSDPKVGCVAGEKRVLAKTEGEIAAEGEGLYWKYESALKRLDSELYSAMGAAGEFCAVRKELCKPMPDNTLLDDFIMSMLIVKQGYKIAYTSDAYAMEFGSASLEEEAKRKRRIAAGGLQSIWWLKDMMLPWNNAVVAFQLVSHRFLRWSITPVALMALIPLNVALVFTNGGTLYTIIWCLQILFYAAAYLGYIIAAKGKKNKMLYIAYYFLFMNINVFRGMAYLMRNGNSGAWEKVKRS
ncbi:MAG: glycosyltransferase family 2 protein [Prevotella sp.]|nr:glycosyltransferase family 2 protein [Prevotella sp.]